MKDYPIQRGRYEFKIKAYKCALVNVSWWEWEFTAINTSALDKIQTMTDWMLHYFVQSGWMAGARMKVRTNLIEKVFIRI